jgi:sulfur carrier protein
MITLYLNKTAISVPENATLFEAIQTKLPHNNTIGIAVALNEKVIPNCDWKTTSLNENDNILIIKATQGG